MSRASGPDDIAIRVLERKKLALRKRIIALETQIQECDKTIARMKGGAA